MKNFSAFRLIIIAHLILFAVPTPAADPAEILSVPRQSWTIPIKRWPTWKAGLAEFAAMTLELYDGQDFFIVGRDGRFLLYALQLAARKEPARLQQIHELEISSYVQSEFRLRNYVGEKGLTPQFFQNGNRAVIIDVCLGGSIIRYLRKLLPPEDHSKITGSYIITCNAESPATRVFLTPTDSLAGQKNPGDFIGLIHSEWEYGLPLPTNTVIDYYRNSQNLIVPEFAPDDLGANGWVSPELHRILQEDLAFYFGRSRVSRHIKKRRALWRHLKGLADRRNVIDLISELKKLLQDGPQKNMAESIVRDFIDRYQNLVSVQDVGLPFVASGASAHDNAEFLMNRFPDWTSALVAPHQEIAAWISEQRFRDIELLAHAVADFRIKRALIELLHHSHEPAAKEILRTVLERPDNSHADTLSCWQRIMEEGGRQNASGQ